MGAIVWDQVGERTYETGTKKGVLYPQAANGTYPNGVPWNGLTSVSESPEGGDANDIYADDIKYLVLRGVENYGGTIEAYSYPDEFEECDGSAQLMDGVTIGQQPRKTFGFSYVSTLGNDTEMDNHGYKIHLVYGASASPSSRQYQTINESPEPINFSWEFKTVPVNVTGHKPAANMVIDSTKFTTAAQKARLKLLENTLYGTDAQEAVPATYAETTDVVKNANKTYYTRTGSSPNYTYTEFTGTAFADGTTYYEMVTPAQDATTDTSPRLPLPDEVLSILLGTT